MPEDFLGSLEWREAGPYRGGRSAAVAGVVGDRDTYYFGATGGGVWKSEDAGISWRSVSDGHFGGSIGAVAVADSDPNVIYVGGGEKTVRGNVSHGDGVYRSTDAGATWQHLGLADSRHVSRLRVHPRDEDHVYACVMGHLFGPNEERGVYRSKDGGASWERLLFVNDQAGCVDLVLDPTNPRILYSTFWRVLRTPYSLESGGEGSSMWKSTDGGVTWVDLSASEGLPAGPLGIMGVTVSPSDPQNLYAMVEAEEGGLFRSRDAGKTWARTSSSRDLRQRAWYYTRLYADPQDAESVYVLNVRFHHSKDGGVTFRQIPTPHSDHHDLWIDPRDPQRMVQGNDGGGTVSHDGGATWSTQTNQPTAQMYRVSVDNSFPYRLLGGQQDNSTVRLRSRSFTGSWIGTRDWQPTAGCECGHVVAKPDDPEIVFGGCYGGVLERVDHRTGASTMVSVWPDDPMGWGASELKYRFQWNFPIFFSPHDPDRLYTAAQVLFRSDDLGQTWEEISGDLTRNDKSKQGSSGGPITQDNTSVEYYAAIFAALESPHEKGVLWTGSDDGLIHLSRDDGGSFANVTPEALPEWTMINSMEAHPFEKGGLYVAGTRYKLDDFAPYLYRTTDYGETWQRIDSGIPRDHFTRVIRADPDRPGLLYAGTERGVYVSFDDGARWQPLQADLPVVPITDLALRDGDLIAATQGRGFWILDDLSPLHQVEVGQSLEAPRLYAPRPAYRLAGGRSREPRNAGTNPPTGAVVHFYLPQSALEMSAGEEAEAEEAKAEEAEAEAAESEEAESEETEAPLRLEILDGGGEIIRVFTPRPANGEAVQDDAKSRRAGDPEEILDLEPGAQRFEWDLRYPGVETVPGMILWNSPRGGPRATPGSYRVRLVVGDQQMEQPFEVLADPRGSTPPGDFEAQFDYLISVRDKLTEVHRAVRRIRRARADLESLDERLDGDAAPHEAVRERAKELFETLDAIEKALYQTRNRSRQDPLNFPIRLNDKLANLLGHAQVGDTPPSSGALAVRDSLFAAVNEQLKALDAAWSEDLPALNAAAAEALVPALAPISEGE
ncbi:MAG: glycosyl hydrolase [Acidobacteriota bacterium]